MPPKNADGNANREDPDQNSPGEGANVHVFVEGQMSQEQGERGGLVVEPQTPE